MWCEALCHAGKHAIFIRFITEKKKMKRKMIFEQFYECAKTICNVALLKNVLIWIWHARILSVFFLQNHIPYDTVLYVTYIYVYMQYMYVTYTIDKIYYSIQNVLPERNWIEEKNEIKGSLKITNILHAFFLDYKISAKDIQSGCVAFLSSRSTRHDTIFLYACVCMWRYISQGGIKVLQKF